VAAGRPLVELDSELPAELAVGAGSCLHLSGSCRHSRRAIKAASAALDGEAHDLIAYGDRQERFWGLVPLTGVASPRQARIDLRIELDGRETVEHRLGEIRLLPELPTIATDARPASGGGPLVAICMATFEPPKELLARQIESIRRQTHERWVCLISDDCSEEAGFERLRELTAGDPRFSLSRSPRRLGHYRNFERALSMVPPEADFVALSDQDDRWYPEKVATLIAAIGGANLVYSDMRVLDESGRLLSDTFWSYKRNNHTNLASLLLDNTVTGAASLFPRRHLELALPFPPGLEWTHHDQWLATVALATGAIAYVDRPLYDYVQHGGAATPIHPSAEPNPPAVGNRDRLAEGRQAYFKDLRRIALAARALEMRVGGRPDGRARRAVRRVARLGEPPEPVVWLLLRSLRPLIGRNETLYTERSLLKAIAWRRLAGRRARPARRTRAKS
jgi:hypothetical protein